MPAPGQVLCTRTRIDLSCLDGATISGMATMLPSQQFQSDRARSRVVSCTHAGDFSREFSCGSIGKISLGVKNSGGGLDQSQRYYGRAAVHTTRGLMPTQGDLAHGAASGVKVDQG